MSIGSIVDSFEKIVIGENYGYKNIRVLEEGVEVMIYLFVFFKSVIEDISGF